MSRNITDSPTFCPLMWLGATRHNDDLYLPCCQYSFEPNDGNTHWGDGLETNMKTFDQDRKLMAEGFKPKSCDNCWHNESVGIDSLRNEVMAMDWWRPFQSNINELTGPDGAFRQTPVYIDLRLGNKCNLGCRMCLPEFSSVLAKEVESNRDKFDYFPDYGYSLDVSQSQTDIDRVFKIIMGMEGLVKLQFTGGEPLLNHQLSDLLDHFVDRGVADKIIIAITTNLTTVSQALLDKFKRFHSLDLSISMEGVGEVYEYIRYPAKWSKIQKNFDTLMQMNLDVNVVYTGTALSILGFPDWLKWVHERQVKWNYNPVIQPKFLSINQIPEALKPDLIARLIRCKEFSKHPESIDGVIAMLEKPQDQSLWELLVKDTITKDSIRQQSIHKSVPKLAVFM